MKTRHQAPGAGLFLPLDKMTQEVRQAAQTLGAPEPLPQEVSAAIKALTIDAAERFPGSSMMEIAKGAGELAAAIYEDRGTRSGTSRARSNAIFRVREALGVVPHPSKRGPKRSSQGGGTNALLRATIPAQNVSHHLEDSPK